MFYVLCIISLYVVPPNWLSKLALSVESTTERRGAVEYGLAEEGMPTTTRSWYKPIVVRDANHYSFVVQTYSGSHIDQYWSSL